MSRAQRARTKRAAGPRASTSTGAAPGRASDGPGFSFSRPIALSRDTSVDLKVISYVDLAIVLGGLLIVAVALPLIARPVLRERVRGLPRGVRRSLGGRI